MMVFPRTRFVATALAVLLAGLLSPLTAARAQETTGSVTGVVKDATGAIVPGAAVTLTDLQTRSKRKTVSNSEGSFTISAVTSSLQYQVEVSMTGFESWESRPFPLRPGDTVSFTDIKLLAGGVSTEVTVESVDNQALKPLDSPERSDVITAKDLETLALEGRDATELVRMLPGFALASPGVNNQSAANTAVVGFSGPTGAYSANGSGTAGTATLLDGVSLTDISTNAGTIQSVNPEMVSEIKVTTSTFSAANAKGPILINATTKAGTTSFHGSAYMYARDTVFNANDWYNNQLRQTRPDGRYFYPGATFSGPLWIPNTRFTRASAKLFFFAGFELYNQLYSPETLGSWVPTLAERTGDFSVSSLNAQLCGARPDGLPNQNSIQPMCNAMNYMPNGATVSNGALSQMANASGKALVNWLPLPNADPFSNLTGFNYVQPVEQTQNGDTLHLRLDFSINDSNKFYATYGRQSQITQDPVAYGYAPVAGVLYPGGVTSGDISSIVSAHYIHVFGSTVSNELSAALALVSTPGNMGDPAAVSRFSMSDYNCSDPSLRAAGTCGTAGNGNFNQLGEYKYAGDYSVPALSSNNGTLGYPNIQMPGGFYNNQVHLKKTVPSLSDYISWTKGPHTFSFGGYFERGTVNGLADPNAFPQGQYTFNPQSAYFDYNAQVGGASQFTGCENPNQLGTSRLSGAAYLGACINPIGMMYTGYSDSFQQTNFTPIVDMQYTTVAGYVNDDWKLHRFTFMLGARIEHLGPWYDKHNNGLATFSPTLYNQQCAKRVCGSQNDPGISWHSVDPSIMNSVNNPAMVYFSPRVGMSWDIFGRGNTVIRGGWGVYRNQEQFAPYALAAATAQGYKTTYQQQLFTFDTIDSQAPINPPDFSAYTVSQSDNVRPIYYEYNGTLSQRIHYSGLHGIAKDSLVEVAYVGSSNQNLSSFNQNSSYNGSSDLNLIPAGFMFQGQPAFSLSYLAAAGLGSGGALDYLTTPQQDFFRPYPFYTHIYALKHDYYSSYNSVQVSFNKVTGPIQFGANYTFSKSLATASSYNNVVANPLNLRDEYNPDPADRTQVFNIHYLVNVGNPYHGGHTILKAAANGWQVSGISTFQSGGPLPSLEGENFGFGYGQVVPTQVYTQQQSPGTNALPCQQTYKTPPDKNGNTFCVTTMDPITWLGTPDYQLMPTLHCNPKGGPNNHQYMNPTCFGVPLPGGPTTGIYALSSNPSGQGQYRLPYIHGPAYVNNDLTLLKNVAVHHGQNIQFRAAAFNFLNHPLVSYNSNDTNNLNLGGLLNATPGTALTIPQLTNQNFGIADIKRGARLMELSAHYTF